jgi:hypothetical protein
MKKIIKTGKYILVLLAVLLLFNGCRFPIKKKLNTIQEKDFKMNTIERNDTLDLRLNGCYIYKYLEYGDTMVSLFQFFSDWKFRQIFLKLGDDVKSNENEKRFRNGYYKILNDNRIIIETYNFKGWFYYYFGTYSSNEIIINIEKYKGYIFPVLKRKLYRLYPCP